MNDALQEFARRTLKEGLARCTDQQVLLFKRMYSPKNLEHDIGYVVDQMPEDKLDWAMQQVDRTLKKNAKAEASC